MEQILLFGGAGAFLLGLILLCILIPAFKKRRRKFITDITEGKEV